MFAVLVMTISVVALTQFALSYVRSMLLVAAIIEISEDVRCAAGTENRVVASADFRAFVQMGKQTSEIASKVTLIGLYHRVLQMSTLIVGRCGAISCWAEREMAMCAHYTGVQVDQRLRTRINLEQVGELI